MRVPVIPNLSTKDGEANKNARMTNCLAERNPTGAQFAAVRPGLNNVGETTGNGNGIVEYNGKLLSVYGANFNEYGIPFPEVTFSEITDVNDTINNEFYVRAVSNGATVPEYSDIMIAGWGEITGAGYNLYVWTETTGMTAVGEPYTADTTELMRLSENGLLFFISLFPDGGNDQTRLCTWDVTNGIQTLHVLNDGTSGTGFGWVQGVTADGDACCGCYRNSGTLSARKPFIYKNGAIIEPTIPESGTAAVVSQVSLNGTYASGYYSAGGFLKPFRWDAVNGIVDIGNLGQYPLTYTQLEGTEAYISDDGAVICGFSRNGGGSSRLFRWTESSGMTDLDSGSSYSNSAVYGMSSDGNTIVGDKTVSGVTKGFVWKAGVGFADVTLPGQSYSSVRSVSDDGLKATGYATVGLTTVAFIWEDGVTTALSAIPGSTRYFARQISRNGSTVAGENYNGSTPVGVWAYGGQKYLPPLRPIAALDDRFFDFAQSVL